MLLNCEEQRLTSEEAQRRLLALPGEPLFYADWTEVLFIHLEVPPEKLQPSVPFELDLHDSRAFVSLVLFTMRQFRPVRGGRLTEWVFRHFPDQHFLNVRTYVRSGEDVGIHFMTEWVSDRLSCRLGPPLYCLPYHLGKHEREQGSMPGRFQACVTDCKTRLQFRCEAMKCSDQNYGPCHAGGLDEFLLERYAAFNASGLRQRAFQIWHPPWQQTKVCGLPYLRMNCCVGILAG
ncbi:MAG TPA: DUF2071 domain-containing protein [Candidatus Binatia bacterium]|jgi:uncharacterized protein YqjF (DUF2071 family)|nr:DUF2071 domain-containing protein [Candidatus Binatia bacterium]